MKINILNNIVYMYSTDNPDNSLIGLSIVPQLKVTYRINYFHF